MYHSKILVSWLSSKSAYPELAYIISQAEAAKMLRVTERTIRNYVAQGYIRRKSIGKKPFYSKKEIIEYLDRKK